ncbi:MAG: Rieske 2Fe-2S domain-containing protein [Actinomycetota bacterium]
MTLEATETRAADEFAGDQPRYPGNLRRYWHPIARSEEVTDSPKRLILLEEPLVAFRFEGKVSVFKDLCIHRGSALSLGSVTKEGHIRCPYHGWEYDGSGACVRIPAKADGSPIPRTARAFAYKAEERYGVVWVAMDDPVFPIPSFPGGEYDDPEWRTFFAFYETWATSAGRILENFCDWSHIPFVHGGILGSEDIPRPQIDPSPVWEKETEEGFTLGYSYEQIDQSDLYGKGGTLSVRRDFVVYLPFMSHLYKSTPDGHRSLLSMAVCPHSPRESTLFLWIARNHSFDVPDDDFRQLSVDVFAQDARVVQSQRPEEIPLDLKEELHIKVPDAFSVEYRRVLQKIGEITPFLPY